MTEEESLLAQLNMVLEKNKALIEYANLQKGLKQFEQETRNAKWYENLVQFIYDLRLVFIQTKEKVAEKARKENRGDLTRIYNSLTALSETSTPLKLALNKHLQKEFVNILARKDLPENERKNVEELREQLIKIDVSNSYLSENRAAKYSKDKGKELHEQNIILTGLCNDMKMLVNENKEVKGLLNIQQELNALKEELPQTFLIKLNKIFEKIKNIFVNSDEQNVIKNREKNLKILDRIEAKLTEVQENIDFSARKEQQEFESVSAEVSTRLSKVELKSTQTIAYGDILSKFAELKNAQNTQKISAMDTDPDSYSIYSNDSFDTISLSSSGSASSNHHYEEIPERQELEEKLTTAKNSNPELFLKVRENLKKSRDTSTPTSHSAMRTNQITR